MSSTSISARCVSGDWFYACAAWYVLCHGMRGPKQAVAEGQYEFPQGLFYGGKCLQPGPQRLLAWMQAHFQDLRQAVCLDVHTGLGRFGQQALWVGESYGSPRFQTMQSYIPAIEPMAQSNAGYKIQGGFLAALDGQLPQANWYCVTQEFGTLGPLKVIKTLRDENLYHHQAPCVEISHPAKQNMLRTFSPASKMWRDRILGRGESLFQHARQLAFGEPVPVRR